MDDAYLAVQVVMMPRDTNPYGTLYGSRIRRVENNGSTMHSQETITVQLSRKTALVLFEFLHRCDNEGCYAFVDQAEQRVLWDIKAAIEPQLPEILAPQYGRLLKDARDQIRDPE